MSTEITTAMVREFAAGIALLQQQKDSRFRDRVTYHSIMNGEALELDQIGSVEMTDIDTRHRDTRTVNTPHRKRVIVPIPASVAELIDPADLRRVLNNPQGSYAANFAAASNRKHDDRVIGCMFATAVTGKGGSSTAAFDTTNFQIAAGAVGLTVSKLRTAAQKLRAAENPKDDGDNKWYVAYSADKLTDLLGTTEVTSSDYNTVKALVQGEIDTFLGFEHVHTERNGLSGSDEMVPAWCKASVALAVSLMGRASISVRNDKEDAIQVRYENDSGATRMDEKGVVQILCS